MHLRRRHARTRWVVAAALTAVTVLPATPAAAAPAAAVPRPITTARDTFSALVGLRSTDGLFVAAIHASVMPDGRVMMLGQEAAAFPTTPSDEGHANFVLTPDPVGAALPATVAEPTMMGPLDAMETPVGPNLVTDTFVCGGHTFLADGRLMITSGSRVVTNASTGRVVVAYGGAYASTFDGTTWSRVPGTFVGQGMTGTTGRWYPTLTRLADGRVLITGGYDLLTPNFLANLSEELYDPATGTYTAISSQSQTPPQAHDADYTAVFQLPGAVQGDNVLMIGEDGLPLYLSTASTPGTWRSSGQLRPGAANGATFSSGAGTAMLPLRLTDGEWGYHNGSVMQVGGKLDTAAMTRADVFDPVTNAWTRSIDIGTPRHYPAPVNLPDGRVLLINGHDSTPTTSVLTPQYLDPARGFAVTSSAAADVEVRGYHNLAVLLPDGRVLVSGGRDVDRQTSSEKPDYTYFSPSYMSKARPVITRAPAQLGYGQTVRVRTSTVRPTDAVLMGLPSMTHSFDANQRSIQVKLTSVNPVAGDQAAGNNQTSSIVGPANAQIAPPGYYMLFVLDANRVPSVAKMVHVG